MSMPVFVRAREKPRSLSAPGLKGRQRRPETDWQLGLAKEKAARVERLIPIAFAISLTRRD